MDKPRSAGRAVAAAAGALILALFAAAAFGRPATDAQGTASPTPYHEAFPVASPTEMIPTVYPLPAAEDLASQDTMVAAGATMIQASRTMAAAARTMAESDDPTVVELGRHWAEDARALAERGAWMVASATAESMVHDPSKARELDLLSLLGNGQSMAAEGQAMIEHGREMVAEVERLRGGDALPAERLDQLAAHAEALIAAGETLVEDGNRMQRDAESLLRSMGR